MNQKSPRELLAFANAIAYVSANDGADNILQKIIEKFDLNKV